MCLTLSFLCLVNVFLRVCHTWHVIACLNRAIQAFYIFLLIFSTHSYTVEIKNKAPVVLCELLFNDKMFKEKQIEKYSNLMLRFTHENQKAQKYLLGGIEKTVEVHEAVLMPKVPHIFKALYEEDILEEEVLFEWAKKVTSLLRIVAAATT